MEDLNEAGGVYAVMNELNKKGLLHTECMTVTGKTLGENIEGCVNKNPEVIRPIDNPYSETGGLAVLKGNLAPDGSVVKRSAVCAEMLVHEGPARIFESDEEATGAIVSAISLGISYMAVQGEHMGISPLMFPILIAALGILSSIFAQVFVRAKEWDNPAKALNIATYVSTLVVLVGSLLLSYFVFNDVYPFYSILSGLVVGVFIGRIAEYYTSDSYRHVKEIAEQSLTGHATNIISGFSIGMQSTALTILLLAAGIAASYLFFGMYGIALGAVGMLSTAGITVSVDAYGPIADNAGGIAEMSNMEEHVREITDHLYSVGNTTAAVGKGFCIGSAAFTALAMIVAYSQLAHLENSPMP